VLEPGRLAVYMAYARRLKRLLPQERFELPTPSLRTCDRPLRQFPCLRHCTPNALKTLDQARIMLPSLSVSFAFGGDKMGGPVAALKLTKRTVDALTAGERAFIAFYSDFHGFGVRVMPTGVKTFIFEYGPNGGGGLSTSAGSSLAALGL
jgi:hypothetical protein